MLSQKFSHQRRWFQAVQRGGVGRPRSLGGRQFQGECRQKSVPETEKKLSALHAELPP